MNNSEYQVCIYYLSSPDLKRHLSSAFRETRKKHEEIEIAIDSRATLYGLHSVVKETCVLFREGRTNSNSSTNNNLEEAVLYFMNQIPIKPTPGSAPKEIFDKIRDYQPVLAQPELVR